MKDFIGTIYQSFLFDRKTMGLTFFVPILVFITALLFILFFPREEAGIYNNVIIIQGVFIPFSCWWLMYRLSELYEEGAQETLAPYYAKRFPVDFIRYYVVNAIGVLILSVALILKYGIGELPLINFFHFFLLLLFYQFLGTSLIVWIKNIEIALTVGLIFTVLEVVTLGEYMPWPHIFLFQPPVWDPFLSAKFAILSVTIGILALFTVVFLKRTDRKPA
ncbi:hypothetical protein HU147_11510 [Planomicrobium chinense]|uniref:hypothetical protein n=1 Tax=Planococcus chinensis TaxID=272917 RepID=UPI001CC64955|nr:hypothetical protein [Planococcus chinensis]MBZ5201846.1 hypothetical protein [Planococcus chinensis]